MPLRDALLFIEELRRNDALRESIRAMEAEPDLQEIVRAGQEAGLTFTADELRAAFGHDTTLRWLRERVSPEKIFEGLRGDGS